MKGLKSLGIIRLLVLRIGPAVTSLSRWRPLIAADVIHRAGLPRRVFFARPTRRSTVRFVARRNLRSPSAGDDEG